MEKKPEKPTMKVGGLEMELPDQDQQDETLITITDKNGKLITLSASMASQYLENKDKKTTPEEEKRIEELIQETIRDILKKKS